MIDRDRMEHIIDLLREHIGEVQEALRQQLSGVPYGHKRATREELLLLVEEKQRQYPPVLLTYPNGEQRYESPWIAAAELSEKGRELLAEWRRAREREEA